MNISAKYQNQTIQYHKFIPIILKLVILLYFRVIS